MTSDNKGDNGEPADKEACRKGRRRFTFQEKAAIIRTVERLMKQHGRTRREACGDLNMDAMLEAKKNNTKAKCIHRGKDSCLTVHTQKLLQFIFELRKQGMAVSVRMVALRAAQLSEQFHEKSMDAQYHSARRFICSQGLVFALGQMNKNVCRERWSRRHWITCKKLPVQRIHKKATDTMISFLTWNRHRLHLLTMHGKPLNLWEDAQFTFASQQATLSVPHLSCL
jgi:hypothetical protein